MEMKYMHSNISTKHSTYLHITSNKDI